ncbi:MAG: DUF4091 domain-containing protein [Fimbriimonadaceae bacterium]|nr:DUF4091 domain-containing protein [Fimbriimonadaceae bacterium]
MTMLALLQLLTLAPGGTVVLDFETPADLACCHYERQPPGTAVRELALAPRGATSGSQALRFVTPQWQEGLARWPAFEITPPLSDWRGYDRLVYDVTNVTAGAQRLNLFISDDQVPVRSGLAQTSSLPPYSHTQVVVPLSGLAEKQVNAAAVTRLHFYTADVPSDMEVYLDHLALLRPADPLPVPSTAYLKGFGALQAAGLAALRQQVGDLRTALRELGGSGAAQAWGQAEADRLAQRVERFAELVAAGDPAVLGAQQAVQDLRSVGARVLDLARFRVASETAGVVSPAAGLACGVASSMVKVLPRAGELPATPGRQHTVTLARRDKESFQWLVVPFGRDLEAVRVLPADLRGPAGAVLPAASVQAAPVGYVKTKTVPPYGSALVGWWPDPLLPVLSEVRIAAGDVQSFWVRVETPATQPAGSYRGPLALQVGGQTVAQLELTVEVLPFTLPSRSPLPLAITFGPHDSPLPATSADQTAWRQSPDYPVNAWKRHKLAWADLLADYYISYDSLYHRGVPDFEVLQHLQRRGALDRFNLGYYGALAEGAAAEAKWRQETLPRLRSGYDRAKALGLLEHAYLYGCDEAPAGEFGGVQRAAAILKAEFPGVLVMTTAYDHSFGPESGASAIDAWCPLTPRLDQTKAAAARAAGREVWWYICCGPHHPHANLFIEYPAIEGRLLMGPLTAKYRPDGFLYYQISIWNSARPITAGPFTDWDPRSWTVYHGDGSWTCVGPDGTPLPTVRLENFRDGLEDYAWWRVLDATAAAVRALPQPTAAQRTWLTAADQALAVPPELVESGTVYSRDPATLQAWRTTLGKLITSAGVPPVEPWAQ